MNKYILTVSCQSTRGIVAALSGYLAEKGCNLVDASQFDALDTGRFFMRRIMCASLWFSKNLQVRTSLRMRRKRGVRQGYR